jgi:hypothetical protein
MQPGYGGASPATVTSLEGGCWVWGLSPPPVRAGEDTRMHLL